MQPRLCMCASGTRHKAVACGNGLALCLAKPSATARTPACRAGTTAPHALCAVIHCSNVTTAIGRSMGSGSSVGLSLGHACAAWCVASLAMLHSPCSAACVGAWPWAQPAMPLPCHPAAVRWPPHVPLKAGEGVAARHALPQAGTTCMHGKERALQ